MTETASTSPAAHPAGPDAAHSPAPYISVMIPTFNREKYLAATIETALQQDFKDYEILVVNDGSTDSTADILASFGDRIRVVSSENKGLGGARNLGLQHTRGTYIALLDDDDLWFPWTLQTYVDVIKKCNNPWLIASTFLIFRDSAPLGEVQKGELRYRYFKDFYSTAGLSFWVAPSGAIFRAEDAKRAGGFFEHRIGHEENDLWIRLGEREGFVIIDHPPSFGRREHDTNLSSFSYRNLLGCIYLLEQEARHAYPGDPKRRRERLSIITSHVRGTSIDCVQKHRQREGWRIYCKAFRWHVSLGRWRYLLAFPFISLAAVLRPGPKLPAPSSKPT